MDSPSDAPDAKDLQRALDHGEFHAFLQPFVQVGTGNVIGGELLARWEHPSRGLLSPAHFLGPLMRAGLVSNLTDVMLRAAATLTQGNTRFVSLNLAATDISDPALGARIDAALSHRSDPTKLCVEILEVDLGSEAMTTIGNLNTRGVQIAVDDFGAAFSSLARVVELRVDIVKLDRSLVCDLDSKPRTQVLLEAFVSAMHELGTAVLAEGIETEAEFEHITRIGCDLAQGYLFARPAPLRAVSGAFTQTTPVTLQEWPKAITIRPARIRTPQ